MFTCQRWNRSGISFDSIIQIFLWHTVCNVTSATNVNAVETKRKVKTHIHHGWARQHWKAFVNKASTYSVMCFHYFLIIICYTEDVLHIIFLRFVGYQKLCIHENPQLPGLFLLQSDLLRMEWKCTEHLDILVDENAEAKN